MIKYSKVTHIFIEDEQGAKFEMPSDAVILHSEIIKERGNTGLKIWYGILYITDEQITQAIKAAQ